MGKKKLIVRALLPLFMMLMVFISCGSKEKSAGNGGAAASGQKAPEKKIFKLASTLAPVTSPIRSLIMAADELREETNGEIDIQVFPASQLGGQRDFTEGVTLGTIEMCLIGVGALESFEPQFAIYGIPFFFKNDDHVYAFYDSDISKKILDGFREKQGLRALGIFSEGFRTVWTKTKQIKTLEDFKGVKMRIPEVPIFVDIFTTLGCNATPLPAGDIYTAIQTGVIDGVELPVSSIVGNKIHEVVKYDTITNHVGGAMVLLINENVYQSMTAEQKIMFEQKIKKASELDRVNLAEDDKTYLQTAIDSGIEVYEMPQTELDKINKAMTPVLEKYFKNISTDTLNQIRAMAN
jgi:tripartite ATP-independent transporter DctP family solute receptor